MKVWDYVKSVFSKNSQEEEIIETIEEIIDEREERGDPVLVDPQELVYVKNLFKLKELTAQQVMIPRAQIIGIPLNASETAIKKMVITDKFTRVPVYDKTLDNIVGVLHTKDLLCNLFAGKTLDIQHIMNENVLFVPPSIKALDLLCEMQAKRTQMVIVVDEYGGTDGLITLEDLLEVVVGKIEDEHDALDNPPLLVKRSNYVVEADANVLLTDLKKKIGNLDLSKAQEADLGTIGGWVFYLAGRLPSKGEVITSPSGIRFQVLDVDARHLKRIKITHFKKRSKVSDADKTEKKAGK